MTWDETYFNLCRVLADRSKDLRTKVGCVIAGSGHEVLSMGYNCFPRNIRHLNERQAGDLKYKWIEHAERNAIYNAARNGICVKDAILFVPWPPCSDCARAIIQSGIKEVRVEHLEFRSWWLDDIILSVSMLEEAGVNIFRPLCETGVSIRDVLEARKRSENVKHDHWYQYSLVGDSEALWLKLDYKGKSGLIHVTASTGIVKDLIERFRGYYYDKNI